MTRQTVRAEQQHLRIATERYLEALPPLYREVFALMAADRGVQPYQVLAVAIERAIADWRAGLLTSETRGRH